MAQHRSTTARDLVITYIKGDGCFLKFWALPLNGMDTIRSIESHFVKIKNDLDSSPRFLSGEQIPVGLKCAVYCRKKNMWCRARVLKHQGYNTLLVHFLDYGNEEVVSVADLRNIDEQLQSIIPQAIECILADVIPANGNEWTPEAIKFCQDHLCCNKLSCFVVSECMKLPVVRVAKKGESEAFVQRLINSGLAHIKPERAMTTPPPTVSYKMNNMDHNSTHLVRIPFIENAHKFYVQLSVAEMELKHLMDSINRIPVESFAPLKVPVVHTPCLTQPSNNPSFYRGLITAIQQNRFKVFFVDYGFSEWKEIHEIRSIPPAFLSLSAQAICCSLPREAIFDLEELKHIIHQFETLDCTVVNRTTEAYIVTLSCRGRDVLSTQNYVQQKLQVGTKCEVTVSSINSLAEFYCHLTHLKTQEDMISNILNSGYNFFPISLNECTPGKPVCVQFLVDNIWYRARVVKANHENDIEVFFVDYGNYDTVSLKEVRKIGFDVLKIPIQAFKCFLFGTTLPTDSKAIDDAFALLEELTEDQSLFAQINAFTLESGYGITLYSKNSVVSINEKIQSSCLSVSTVPVNDVETVYVTSFDSPDSFFGQFEKLDSDKLTEMQNEINTFYAGFQNSSYIPMEGSLVCARFNEDDQFYRARVEMCKEGFCDVYFIDYGNRESIPLKDVHCMDITFTKYPQFGIECSFENCPSQIPNAKISDLIFDHSIQLKMVRKENDKWFVSLVESFPGNVAILELLRHCEKPAPRSIHGTGLSGYQERSFNEPRLPRADSKAAEFSKTSHFNSNAAIRSYDNNERSNNEFPKRSNQTKEFEDYSNNKFPKRSNQTKEFEDYSLISIPNNAYRNVYVSHAINPSEFYCQIEEDSNKLQSLMKTIEDTYTVGSDLGSLDFVVDAPCCAVFEDGAWYRGKIQKVDPQSCDVFFVDYGNTDSVAKSKIKMLRNDLFRWPCQALCCKAFNVSPKGKDWSEDESNAFINMTLDKSFVAQFVECDSNDVYSVNLVSLGKLQQDVFNKEFVSMGFGRLQDSSKTLVLNSHAASTNLSFSPLDAKVGSSEAVTVTYGLNLGEIFCQLKSYAESFNQMMMNLQKHYKVVPEAESLIDRPHQGMICAAQFFLDSAWYRAEIKKVESNKIVVFYVDYGNTETVDRKKVRYIVQEYTTLPMQAIKCHIRGIKPPGNSWTVNNNLGKYFEGNCVCKFVSKEGDTFLVDLTCNEKDVAELFILDKLALSDSPTPPIKIESSKIKHSDVPKTYAESPKTAVSSGKLVPGRKDSFVLGQLLSVTVSFIENPSKFWCQLLDECDILNDLMADIENQISDICQASPASLNVGSYCIAQYFEDEAWYRAQIKSCESANTYKVFFIDYGNSEVVSEAQMKVMLPEFMKHPPQCFECRLLNTPLNLSPEMTSLFRETVEEVEEITAKVESVQSCISTVTLLFDKDDQEINVNELLFGVKEHIEERGALKEPPRYLPPDVPLGLQKAYVSSLNSPQDFYIQLASAEDALADLSTELADVSELATRVEVAELCVGYACASKYSEDNNWYRAEIIALKDSTVDILFVDYGNIDTVEKELLKNLTEKHIVMPPLAIKCKLNGIVPAAEEWSDEAITTFQDMVLDSLLGITFISKDIPATVNITKDDKEISQCLVDMELANVETCTETDEAYAEDHLAPAPTEDPLSSLPNDQCYPERKLRSAKLAVKICYVDAFDKFYITPLELGTDLETVMNTLSILYTSNENLDSEDLSSSVPEVLDEPKVSMPCVAKYSEDDNWYRALITEVNEENIIVSFIDHGNSEVTSVKNLRPLTPELVKIPPMAVECSLFGIEAIDGQEQAIATKLEDYFVNEEEFEMEICEFSPYKIKLHNNDGDVGSLLIAEGLAKEQLVLPVESETFVDNSKMTFVDESLEYRIQISKRFFSGADKITGNVKFCEIENDLVVFHVVSTDLEDDLQDLQQKLQDAYSEPPENLANVACMDFCATKYMEDENWYRAQVLSCDKDKVKVRFIDYGNCETVDKSDIYELSSDFITEPQFSVKCILCGLKADKCKEVELQNRLDEYVYHEPVELILCKQSHALYDLCITSLICGDTNISQILTNEGLVSQQYIFKSQLDVKFKATIQKLEGDIVFLLPSSAIDERAVFQSKLQDICTSLEISSEVQTQYLYGTKIDDIWYRASVISISDNEVTVDLVDFGTTKAVNKSEFVLLPLDVCHQPIFLQPCVVKSLEGLTGNAKIDIQHLSIGSEILCEVQKTYPVIHPFTIKVLESYSNSEDKGIISEEKVVMNEEEFNQENSAETNSNFEESIEKSETNAETEEEEELNKENSEVAKLNYEENTEKSKANSVIEEKEFNEENNSNFEESIEKSETKAVTDEKEFNEENFEEANSDFEESIEKSETNALNDEEELIKENYEELDKENVYIDDKESCTEADLDFEKNIEKSEENLVIDEEELNKENIDDEDKENCPEADLNFGESTKKSKENVSGEEYFNKENMDDDDEKENCIEADSNFQENVGKSDSSNAIFDEEELNKEKIDDDEEKENCAAEADSAFEENIEKYDENVVLHEEELHKEGTNNDDKENSAEADLTFEEISQKFEENVVIEEEDLNKENVDDEYKENCSEADLNFGESTKESKENVSGEEDFNKENIDDNEKENCTEADSNFGESTKKSKEIVSGEEDFNKENIDDNEKENCTEADSNFDKNNFKLEKEVNKYIIKEEKESSVKKLNEKSMEDDEDDNESYEADLNFVESLQEDVKDEVIAIEKTVKSIEVELSKETQMTETNELEESEASLYCDNSTNVKKDPESVDNSSGDMAKENNRGIEDSYQLSGSVQVKVCDIAVSDGSVIFAVQPLYLEEEFLLLKKGMHNDYSSKALPYDALTNFCAVLHDNEWCRGKILEEGEDTCTVMLVDYGKCVSVASSNVKNLNNEHRNVPPFAVWCTLPNVICLAEKSETAKTFLNDKLKNNNANIKILEGDEPYKINIFSGNSNILNELLKNNLVTQKLPSMYLEPGTYKAKLSFLNVNSEILQIFVNLSAFSVDCTTLIESMQNTYKTGDFVTNVVESAYYAIFYNETWHRGLVVFQNNEAQVRLVDTGETISDCKSLCFLLPEHCLQPAYAIPCHVPLSDIKATNTISESVNNVLKATEFLVNIEVCPNSNSINAVLIDEQVVSEVKNIGEPHSSLDSETGDLKYKDLETKMSNSSEIKISPVDSSPLAMKAEEPEKNEQLVEYLEETFTTDLP